MTSSAGGTPRRMSGSERLSPIPTSADFIIVGAGIAGLAAAESLRRAGCNSMIVLEARGRIGGRIYTDDLLGFPIDLGASWIRGVDRNPLADVPIRLEGLSNVMIFDQKNRPLPEETSRNLVDSVWSARERLIFAAASSSDELDSVGDSSMMPPSSLLSPTTSRDAKAKRRKLRRRQSWWERRRLGALDDALSPAGNDDMEQGHAKSDEDFMDAELTHPVSLGALTQEPESLPEDPSAKAPLGGLVGKDISVRDWIMDEEEFCEDLNKTDTSRRILIDLINIIENLEAVDLDSIGLLHYDRRGFSGPHLYVADGMAELVGATASGIIGEGKNILRVNHIVSKIDYSTDPSTDPYPVKLYTNRGLYRCRSAIVTIPLGVLKHHHTTLLQPPLSITSPKHKSAVERLGFGLIDKVILEFASPFWPDQLDGFWAFLPPLKRGMDFDEGEDAPALVGFVNMERMHAEEIGDNAMEARIPGPPVLVAYVSQRSALRIEQMEDGEVGDLFVEILRKCFGAISDLVSVRVTRWDIDPFSRGACTYIPVGVSTPSDIVDLSTPLPFPSAKTETPQKALYFAGEHCSRHHFGTVHGALMSGWSTAVKAARDFGLQS
ncbi:amine oxidase [Chytridium lagenaria]|nr:amine oxidase [Chytridium lagenaria]